MSICWSPKGLQYWRWFVDSDNWISTVDSCYMPWLELWGRFLALSSSSPSLFSFETNNWSRQKRKSWPDWSKLIVLPTNDLYWGQSWVAPEIEGFESYSTLTCPKCVNKSKNLMPTNACQFLFDCPSCGALLSPKKGDCCVYCSFGDVKCPPIQLRKSCCSWPELQRPMWQHPKFVRLIAYSAN